MRPLTGCVCLAVVSGEEGRRQGLPRCRQGLYLDPFALLAACPGSSFRGLLVQATPKPKKAAAAPKTKKEGAASKKASGVSRCCAAALSLAVPLTPLPMLPAPGHRQAQEGGCCFQEGKRCQPLLYCCLVLGRPSDALADAPCSRPPPSPRRPPPPSPRRLPPPRSRPPPPRRYVPRLSLVPPAVHVELLPSFCQQAAAKPKVAKKAAEKA